MPLNRSAPREPWISRRISSSVPVAIFVASMVPKAPDGIRAKSITQSSASTGSFSAGSAGEGRWG